MKFRIVIPARFASVRLPGKPLRELAGKPMLHHVCDRARESGAAEIVVATDDARIENACRAYGVDVEMTDSALASGTDRAARVALVRGWNDTSIVVNVQGDEPLMAPAAIRQAATLLARSGADIATLVTSLTGLDEFLDPNVVKAVTDARGRALYFSRAPVPWSRDGAQTGVRSQTRWQHARRHIGLYAYSVRALRTLSATPVSELETLERLEQLRALSCGLSIAVGEAEAVPGPGVDTEHDLDRVEALLRSGAMNWQSGSAG